MHSNFEFRPKKSTTKTHFNSTFNSTSIWRKIILVTLKISGKNINSIEDIDILTERSKLMDDKIKAKEMKNRKDKFDDKNLNLGIHTLINVENVLDRYWLARNQPKGRKRGR